MKQLEITLLYLVFFFLVEIKNDIRSIFSLEILCDSSVSSKISLVVRYVLCK